MAYVMANCVNDQKATLLETPWRNLMSFAAYTVILRKGLLKIPRGKGIDALRGFIAFCIIIIAFGIPL